MTMAILSGYLVITLVGLPGYLGAFSVNTVLGVIAIIFTWHGEAKGQRIVGYLIAVSTLLVVHCRIPSKFILYSAIGISVFSLIETLAGKAGLLAILCLVIMSPLFEYFANVFSFPIRLQLTQMAGQILHGMDGAYHAEGNVLIKGSTEFSVDAACMGLHMMTSSLLTGMILLGIYQRRQKKRLSLLFLLIVALAIFVLNLFSNLIRIISLVKFQVAPENVMHSIIGLACFVLYILLPSAVLVKYIVSAFGKVRVRQMQNFEARPKVFNTQFPLLIIVSLIVLGSKDRSVNFYLTIGTIKAPGYRIEKLQDAIVKLSTDKGLVYLKPIIGFYSSDHQPTLCWKGSGYEFGKLETCDLDGQMIYCSNLQRGSDRLYTAWWYDNGSLRTVSQFTWRWDSFKNGKAWALVNVTAESKTELFEQIRQIRRINPCYGLLNPAPAT